MKIRLEIMDKTGITLTMLIKMQTSLHFLASASTKFPQKYALKFCQRINKGRFCYTMVLVALVHTSIQSD